MNCDFEKYSNFAVGHGDAISVGMLIALDFSLHEKLISKSLFDNIYSCNINPQCLKVPQTSLY